MTKTVFYRAIFAAALSIASSAQAHMVEAQRGTLNFIDNSVYVLLSVPVSTFVGVDDDLDGHLSAQEFDAHRARIISTIEQRLIVRDAQADTPLSGIMLTPVTSHNGADTASGQLIVMGRFVLDAVAPDARIRLALYGTRAVEQEFTITRKFPQSSQRSSFVLTPASPSAPLFEPKTQQPDNDTPAADAPAQ